MKTLLLIILQLASSGADAYYTHRNVNPHWKEDNPIVRPFVQTTAGQISYFSGDAGLKIALPRLLRKHRKWARGVEIGGIVDNVEGAAWSAAHH